MFDLPVASKGKIESWRFLVVGTEEIQTGNGRISAVRVERVRENSERKTVSWHASAYRYLPVKVEQIEPDGERLVSIRPPSVCRSVFPLRTSGIQQKFSRSKSAPTFE